MNNLYSPTNCSQVYRVLNPCQLTSSQGDNYQAFKIYDGDKKFTAHAWKGQYQGPVKLDHGQKVHIQGKWTEFNGQSLLKCHSISPTSAESVAMSRSRKRARVLFLMLTSNVLRQFITKIFKDEGMFEYFLTQPSATNSMHNYPGGLLINSVSSAWYAFLRSKPTGKYKDVEMVGYLLSDLGWSYFQQKNSSSSEYNISSSDGANSMKVLDDAILWLDNQDEYLGLMIRHYLAWH